MQYFSEAGAILKNDCHFFGWLTCFIYSIMFRQRTRLMIASLTERFFHIQTTRYCNTLWYLLKIKLILVVLVREYAQVMVIQFEPI